MSVVLALSDLVVWFVTLIQRVLLSVGLGLLLVAALIGVIIWQATGRTR